MKAIGCADLVGCGNAVRDHAAGAPWSMTRMVPDTDGRCQIGKPLQVTILNWRTLKKDRLQGTVDVQISGRCQIGKPLQVTILNWRTLKKDRLQGTVDVQISLLRTHDDVVFARRERQWANLPSRLQLVRDGAVQRDASTAKTLYAALKFRNRETPDKFLAGLIAALLAANRDALDGDA